MNMARTISGRKVKVQGHGGHFKFLSCPPCDSVPIWLISFILTTNISHDASICRDPLSCQNLAESLHILYTYNTWGDDVSHTIFRMKKVKSQGHTGHSTFLPFPFYSTHNPLGHNVSRNISKSKVNVTWVTRSWSHGSFEIYVVSAPWLPPYLTKSHHMWYIHKIWGDDVSRTTFRMKGQRSRTHRSFEIFLVSSFYLRPYSTDSLHTIYTHNPWSHNVLRSIFRTNCQRSSSHRLFKILTHSSLWLRLFGWITAYVAYIQHMSDYVSRIIWGWQVKRQVHTGYTKFLACPLRGFLLI